MDTQPRNARKVWIGSIVSALPVLMMLLSGTLKLTRAPPVVAGWTQQFGYPLSALIPIGLVEIACALIYVVPRTAVLGAVLITGYLGGAVATHVRVLDPSGVTPFVLGMLAWLGLWLRDERVRALLPLRAR